MEMPRTVLSGVSAEQNQLLDQQRKLSRGDKLPPNNSPRSEPTLGAHCGWVIIAQTISLSKNFFACSEIRTRAINICEARAGKGH